MGSNEVDTWIQEFCSTWGNDYFVIVEKEFIMDKFNLTGLNRYVSHFDEALNSITNTRTESDNAAAKKKKPSLTLEGETILLYGLIHARFIQTHLGLMRMLQKYHDGVYGFCPRVYCASEKLLPVALSDTPGEGPVKNYCPRCKDIYTPKATKHRYIDGAFFGTGFPQLFFMNFPKYYPSTATGEFVPKLYGFKIHPKAYEIQRGPMRDPAAAFKRCIHNVLGPSLSKILSNHNMKGTLNKKAATSTPHVILTASSSTSISSSKSEDDLV